MYLICPPCDISSSIRFCPMTALHLHNLAPSVIVLRLHDFALPVKVLQLPDFVLHVVVLRLPNFAFSVVVLHLRDFTVNSSHFAFYLIRNQNFLYGTLLHLPLRDSLTFSCLQPTCNTSKPTFFVLSVIHSPVFLLPVCVGGVRSWYQYGQRYIQGFKFISWERKNNHKDIITLHINSMPCKLSKVNVTGESEHNLNIAMSPLTHHYHNFSPLVPSLLIILVLY